MCSALLFNSCEKEEEINNSTNNSAIGTISDVVGDWKLIGRYDAAGNLETFMSLDYENCMLQTSFSLESDGDAVMDAHYLQDEVSGPCVSQTIIFQFNYINSTTLEFINISSCGNIAINIINNGDRIKIPDCNGDDGTFDGGYSLWEKQP